MVIIIHIDFRDSDELTDLTWIFVPYMWVVCIARVGYLGPDDCKYMPGIVLCAFGICLWAVVGYGRYIQFKLGQIIHSKMFKSY